MTLGLPLQHFVHQMLRIVGRHCPGYVQQAVFVIRHFVQCGRSIGKQNRNIFSCAKEFLNSMTCLRETNLTHFAGHEDQTLAVEVESFQVFEVFEALVARLFQIQGLFVILSSTFRSHLRKFLKQIIHKSNSRLFRIEFLEPVAVFIA
jgi:hypothetical protein